MSDESNEHRPGAAAADAPDAAAAAPRLPRPDPLPAWPAVPDDLAEQVRRFFRDGRIEVIPARPAKRGYLLDYLAQCFEPGVRYPEPEVNEVLRRFHEDCAALRRYLVEGLYLTRADGFYWRSGGTVEAG